MQAEAYLDEVREQQRLAGKSWMSLTAAERTDLMLIYHEAKQRGVSLRSVWEAYLANGAPKERKTLAEAIQETILAKRKQNLRSRYIESLERYLNQFAEGRTGCFVDEIGVAEIEAWFESRNESASTRNSNLGRLSSMFDLCWRRGYIRENPCLRVSRIQVDHKSPTILTPDQAKRMLRACPKKFLPYLVLGMFAGIRPEELCRLKWSDIDLQLGTVRIDAAASKVRDRRIVKLHDVVKSWLTQLKQEGDAPILSLSPATVKRYRKKLAEAAGIEWEQDILRHTAASYLLQLHRSAANVALMLGNSERILEKHYKQLVTDEACQQFWELAPESID